MDINSLVSEIRLAEIRLVGRTGRLITHPEEGLATLSTPEPPTDLSLDLRPVSWGKRIETWFRLKADFGMARIGAEIATIYLRESDEEIPEPVKQDFLQRVAVMAAYPYLRVEMQHLAADLQLGQFTLGVMSPGNTQLVKREPDSD